MSKVDRVDVVVIDDDDGVRWLLEEVLKAGGVSHRTAASGPEGLRLVAEHQPHLAIIDVKLGAMNGLDVARRLHAVCDKTRALFVTGYGDLIESQVNGDLPLEGIIEKPFDVAEFLKTVKDVLSRIKAGS